VELLFEQRAAFTDNLFKLAIGFFVYILHFLILNYEL
jgi:hypothetical protein